LELNTKSILQILLRDSDNNWIVAAGTDLASACSLDTNIAFCLGQEVQEIKE